jgi:hypothetical protein
MDFNLHVPHHSTVLVKLVNDPIRMSTYGHGHKVDMESTPWGGHGHGHLRSQFRQALNVHPI